tara:strand:+ start:2754 stop:3836 length:1083 start_codon:yes stop_codon:yes gene_type:complete
MKYPINIPHLYEEDKKYATEAIKTGWISSAGPMVKKFEDEFSKFCDRKYAVSVSNGSCALLVAVASLKLPKGSEVILPSTTIISCYNSIVQNDLVPVFCDVDLDTWTICPDSIEEKINDKTSAIMVVDLYGNMINVDRIKSIAKDNNLKVIEDAAEAHGAKYKDIVAGSFGDVSIFSFYSNKIITTGEGGMVVTDDLDIYQNAVNMKNLYFENREKYIHSDIGYNFRMTNVQAGLGLGQLENVNKTIEHRRRIAKRYNERLRNNKYIQLPIEKENFFNVYWYFSILIKENKKLVIDNLTKNKIGYRHFFKPLHTQSFINAMDMIPNSEYLHSVGINLPTYNDLTNDDIDFICDKILEVLE